MRYIALILLTISLAGCGAYDLLSEGLAYAKAVENDLAAETGVKPEVFWQWHNGSFVSVTVMFPRLYTEKPLPELSETVRTVVIRDFKQSPKQLLLSFALSN